MSQWVWIQEGSLSEYLYTQGVLSGDVCWVPADLWGTWPPFFAIPPFAFKSTFCAVLLMSFRQSHMRWLGLLHPKQLFFCWYSSNTLKKWMMYSIGWSVLPTPPDVVTSSSAEDSVSPPTLLCNVVFLNLIAANGHSLSSESVITFQLAWGKKVLCGLRTCHIWHTGHSCLWGQWVPSLCPSFQLPCG